MKKFLALGLFVLSLSTVTQAAIDPSLSFKRPGVADQVAIWSGPLSLTGSSQFMWDRAKQALIIGGKFSNAKISVDALNFTTGILTANSQYGIIAQGQDSGIQATAIGPNGTGVSGIGEFIGVEGKSHGRGGYALYGQQADPNSYGLYVSGGKNYLSGPTLIRSNLTIGSAGDRVGITLYDEDNNEPVCLIIKSGQPVVRPGTCPSTS